MPGKPAPFRKPVIELAKLYLGPFFAVVLIETHRRVLIYLLLGVEHDYFDADDDTPEYVLEVTQSYSEELKARYGVPGLVYAQVPKFDWQRSLCVHQDKSGYNPYCSGLDKYHYPVRLVQRPGQPVFAASP